MTSPTVSILVIVGLFFVGSVTSTGGASLHASKKLALMRGSDSGVFQRRSGEEGEGGPRKYLGVALVNITVSCSMQLSECSFSPCLS